MTTLALSFLRSHHSKAKSKVAHADFAVINWKAICIFGIIASMFSLLFYIYQINNLTRGTYFVSSYQKNIDSLLQENRKLEAAFAENSFLGDVEQKTQELNFQKTTSVKYIQITDNSLAKK